MRLNSGSGGAGGFGGAGGGGGPRSFTGARRLPMPFGFMLLGAVLLLFVTCGGRKASVRDDAPSEENPKRVSAVSAAPSLLDRGFDTAQGAASDVSWLAVLLSPALGIHLGYRWVRNRTQYVMPDTLTGLTPVRMEDAAAIAVASIAKLQEIELEKAMNRTEFPTGVTHVQVMERKVEPTPPPQKKVTVPSIEDLRAEKVFKPERVYLGESLDGPVFRIWKKDGSAFVAAQQGGGKSNLMALAAIQVLECGGRVDIIDIHSKKDESLVNYLGPLADERVLGGYIARDVPEAKNVMRQLKRELLEIIEQGGVRAPRLILIDEGNGTASRPETATEFVDLMKLIAQESRGFFVSGIVAVQDPRISGMGGKAVGGAIRDCLGWTVCGKIPVAMAKIALRTLSNEDCPKDTGALPPGHMYVLDASGKPQRIVIPEVTKRDLAAVAADRLAAESVSGVTVLAAEAALSPAEAPEALEPPEAVEIAPTAPRRALVEDVDLPAPDESADDLAARQEREVIRLKATGLKDIDIVRQVYGTKAASGRAYDTTYLPKVTGVMSRMAQQYAGAASPLESAPPVEDDLLD